MDVNGQPIPKFVAQLRDDAARIRENIAMRPNLDQTDLAAFTDMAYTQAVFDMAADTIEKVVEGCAVAAETVAASRCPEYSIDWNDGFGRGADAAADRIREITNPQQPTAA